MIKEKNSIVTANFSVSAGRRGEPGLVGALLRGALFEARLARIFWKGTR